MPFLADSLVMNGGFSGQQSSREMAGYELRYVLCNCKFQDIISTDFEGIKDEHQIRRLIKEYRAQVLNFAEDIATTLQIPRPDPFYLPPDTFMNRAHLLTNTTAKASFGRILAALLISTGWWE